MSLCLRLDDDRGSRLRNGHIKSCGCLRLENLNFVQAGACMGIDMTGRRVGRLTVLERCGSDQSRRDGSSHALWRCVCDCGNELLRSARICAAARRARAVV